MIAWEQEVENMQRRISEAESVLQEIRLTILRRWDFPADRDMEHLEMIDRLLGQLPKCGSCEMPTVDNGACLHCGAKEG